MDAIDISSPLTSNSVRWFSECNWATPHLEGMSAFPHLQLFSFFGVSAIHISQLGRENPSYVHWLQVVKIQYQYPLQHCLFLLSGPNSVGLWPNSVSHACGFAEIHPPNEQPTPSLSRQEEDQQLLLKPPMVVCLLYSTVLPVKTMFFLVEAC